MAEESNSKLMIVVVGLLGALIISSIAVSGGFTDTFEGSEERFVVFPTYAAIGEDGSLTVPLRAWVFEPEKDSIRRNMFVDALREFVDLDDAEQKRIFEARVRPFLVDNERGKQVVAHLDDQRWILGESAPHGHVTKTVDIPADVASKVLGDDSDGGILEMRFTADFGGEQSLEIPVVGRKGVSVVSDIDDTIKITEVLDREAMLRRTFAREFAHVEGMPALFSRLKATYDPAFHYLSASPWQLHESLDPWLERAGYPDGPLHLRRLRPINPASIHDFVRGSRSHKISTLERLLDHHPERTFILIGDSGEHDPEVYGDIARKYPDRIDNILIRKVPDAKNGEERFEKAFENIPAAKWRAFSEPDDVLPTEEFEEN
mgnify:CR=1 FL=1